MSILISLSSKQSTNEGNTDIKMYIYIVETEVMEKEKPLMSNLDNGFA